MASSGPNRTNTLTGHVVKGYGVKGCGRKGYEGAGNSSTANTPGQSSMAPPPQPNNTALDDLKMRKFRVHYTMAANEGGFDHYNSGLFDDRRGTWFEKWNDPDANIHEDIFNGPRNWRFKGYAFWPANHRVILTEEEFWWLWPGLANHGMPDASGANHYLQVEGGSANRRQSRSRRGKSYRRRGSGSSF